jgi:hypothetical protein
MGMHVVISGIQAKEATELAFKDGKQLLVSDSIINLII